MGQVGGQLWDKEVVSYGTSRWSVMGQVGGQLWDK